MKCLSCGCTLGGLGPEPGCWIWDGCLPGPEPGLWTSGLPPDGLPPDGLPPDGRSTDGLEGCLSAGLISGFGLLSDGLAVPEGLVAVVLPDGLAVPEGLVAVAFPDGLVLPEGLVTVAFPDGLAVPEGLVAVAFPDGLAVPEGLVAVAFPDGLPSEREEDVRAVVFFLPEDDLVTEELLFEASFFVLEDALEYEEDDDWRELPCDCASVSTPDTDNANPISIAARVLTDNLMIEKV